jgi:MFS family permease
VREHVLAQFSAFSVLSVLLLVTTIDQADGAVVSAVGPALKRSFHLSNAGLGLLAGSVSIGAAVATVPAETLVDRVRRGRVLGAAVASWTAAMVFTGAAAPSPCSSPHASPSVRFEPQPAPSARRWWEICMRRGSEHASSATWRLRYAGLGIAIVSQTIRVAWSVRR